MAPDPHAPAPLSAASRTARLALIGAVVAISAGAFAYTGGWLSPGRLTPERMMAALKAGGGSTIGFRRNHAKGLCVTGIFDSNGQAAALSTAAVFRPGRVPLVGRISLAGGMAFQPDKPGAIRAMALQFLPPGGAEWRTGMISLPVFPVHTPQQFYALQIATAPDPATGKPVPAKVGAFLAANPAVPAALGLIGARPIAPGFAGSTYYALNAFRLIDAEGAAHPVRWSVVPLPAAVPETPAGTGDNALFDSLITSIAHQPAKWSLILTLADPGDPTDDASKPWPPGRKQIDAGTITLDRTIAEDGGPCTAINYDPLVLPPGIEPSDDPLLSARSAAYARSFTLRASDPAKPPSAITPQDVRAQGGRS